MVDYEGTGTQLDAYVDGWFTVEGQSTPEVRPTSVELTGQTGNIDLQMIADASPLANLTGTSLDMGGIGLVIETTGDIIIPAEGFTITNAASVSLTAANIRTANGDPITGNISITTDAALTINNSLITSGDIELLAGDNTDPWLNGNRQYHSEGQKHRADQQYNSCAHRPAHCHHPRG